MDPIAIIDRFYPPDSIARKILLVHGRQVADKALAVAQGLPELNPDLAFIEAAALLHDIGMIRTRVPELDCRGKAPYIQHGIIGREMLESVGMVKHALVCERHVGVGITVEDIREQRLPLPERDMRPVTLEEQIICYADKFFSKKPGGDMAPEKNIEKISKKLLRRGNGHYKRFADWVARFDKITG
ncbi:MAG: HD domain-containing protein [Pseudomonadota bacterium]